MIPAMQPHRSDSDFVRLAVSNLISDPKTVKMPRHRGRWLLLGASIAVNAVFVGAIAMLSAQTPAMAVLLGSGSGAIVGLFVTIAQSVS